MRRNPIHHDSDTSYVQGVDEELEIFRRPIAAGRRIKSSHLVAPGRIVSVLGNGQEFDMCEAHPLHVLNQGARQLAVPERFGHAFFLP